MSRKAKKYIVILLTVCFGAAVFTLNAFAQIDPLSGNSPSSQISAPDSSSAASTDGSSMNESLPAGSGTVSEPAESGGGDGNGGIDVPDNPETITVKLDYNDGSELKIITVAPGTQVKTLAVPKRSGYSFDCWTMNGVEVSPSLEIYSEITLTARWVVNAESSQKPSSYASVDTHESEIEQAASRAEQAISDPDALSSQDWNSLLSTGSEAEAGTDTQSSEASSQPEQNGGGSWLFPVGIGLIILAACGIGAFVYLQFFSGPGPGRPGPKAGTDEHEDTDFTDISSNSDSTYDEPEDEPDDAGDETAHMYEEGFSRPVSQEIRSMRDPAESGHPKAQARPRDGEKGNYDWDKFFNDDI